MTLRLKMLLGVVGAVALFAAPNATAITPAQCDAQVNDTPSKLIPCIQQDDLWQHMQESRRSPMRIRAPPTGIRRAIPASRATRRRRTTLLQ